MGHFQGGDVLLAMVSLDDRSIQKTRPVVVIASDSEGKILVCPISSKPPSDAPGIPVSLDDFSSGGLDIFGESYVLTSRVIALRTGEVLGKKGRLAPGPFSEIAGRVCAGFPLGTGSRGNERRS